MDGDGKIYLTDPSKATFLHLPHMPLPSRPAGHLVGMAPLAPVDYLSRGHVLSLQLEKAEEITGGIISWTIRKGGRDR